MRSAIGGPSNLVARYLFDSERDGFRGEWRRHPVHLWKEALAVATSPFVVGFVLGTAGPDAEVFTRVVMVLWAAVLLWAGWRTLDWWHDRFVLTNRRVMVVSGLLSRRVAMMPLRRVTDMAYQQSILGRVLRYGTFVLESAGQDQVLREIEHLPNPDQLYTLMCEEMYGAESPVRTRSRRVIE